jgi:hypothetical protein
LKTTKKDQPLFPEFGIYISLDVFTPLMEYFKQQLKNVQVDTTKNKIAVRTDKFNLFVYGVKGFEKYFK